MEPMRQRESKPPLGPTPTDELLRDWLGEASRKERRALLGVSTLTIFIVYTGLLPSKLEAVDLVLTGSHKAAFLRLLLAVQLYFTLTFVLYAFHDLVRWQWALYRAGKEWGGVASLFSLRRRNAGMGEEPERWAYARSGALLSWLRTLWDFVLPFGIALFAIAYLSRRAL